MARTTVCAAFLVAALAAAACVQAMPRVMNRRDAAADGFVFQRSVIVMTHGASSLPADVMWGVPGFPSYDNYSSGQNQLPSWGVGPMELLPEGNKTVFAIGAQLKERLRDPVTVVFDAAERASSAKQSSAALADGLNASMVASNTGFNGVNSGFCAYPANSTQFLDAHWKATPALDTNLLQRLQAILGSGVAPAIQSANNNVTTVGADGRPIVSGGIAVGALFAEAFLMQTLGDLPVAWNELEGDDLYDFLKIHQYYVDVIDRVPELVHFTQSAILNQVVEALAAPTGNGSTVFVNTPSSIIGIAAMLNLTWSLGGTKYGDNAVPPASAIEFQVYGHGDNNLTDARVYINYLYTRPGSNTVRNTTVTSALPTPAPHLSWSEFSAAANRVIYQQCINAPPAPSSGGDSSQLSTGAIVGIIIGCVAGVILVAGVIVYKRRQSKGSYRAL